MDDIVDDDHEPIICRPHNCRMMEIAQMAIKVALNGSRKNRWEFQFLKIIADERRLLTASTGSKRDRMLQNLETAGFLRGADGMYNVNYYSVTPKGRRAILK